MIEFDEDEIKSGWVHLCPLGETWKFENSLHIQILLDAQQNIGLNNFNIKRWRASQKILSHNLNSEKFT